MNLRIFNDLEARLASVRLVGDGFRFCRDPHNLPGSPAIRHYALWNEDAVRLSQSRPFAPPAVFVEFLPEVWSPLQRGAFCADIYVRLHIVTATLAQSDTPYRDEALLRFRLIRAIRAALVDFDGPADSDGRSFSRFVHVGSETDHNHDQVAADIEEWRTHAVDCASVIDDGYIVTPTNVSLDTGDIFAPPFSDIMV